MFNNDYEKAKVFNKLFLPVLKKEIKGLDDLHVIVEADRLREIKPENIITIKMTISEQGMEWINMEDRDGEIVNKLLPE